ncbi:MAG: histidine phosphatase family protein [Chloroflexota bacterium]
MTRRLLLVRHGVTTWNREGRFQGHRDPPLDAAGELEARLLADRLVVEEPDPIRIVTSPLQRAAATAAALAAALEHAGRPPELTSDPRLMEIGQGEWEGRTHAELVLSDPVRYAAWRRSGATTTPPGGEAIEAARQRVVAALDELTRDEGGPMCLVSHGGILRLAGGHLLGLVLRRAWSLDVDNASLSRLTRGTDSEGWRIDAWNDTGHLLGHTTLHQDEAEGQPLAL